MLFSKCFSELTTKEKFPPLREILSNSLQILLSATILSIIIKVIIEGTIGADVFAEVLFFPSDIGFIYPYYLVGLFILILGAIFVVSANYYLLVKGRIGLEAREPFHVPSCLITSGPYNYSRNPIYLGVVLMLLGFALIVVSISVLIFTIVTYLLFWRYFVRWEEKKLEEAFGKEYLLYKERVRRWL